MRITAYKTPVISPETDEIIYNILDHALPDVPEKSIVVITSKIISLCQGRTVPINGTDKQQLIENESSYYLPKGTNPLGITLTITHNLLMPAAGIDESNGNGYYILWPKNLQETARNCESNEQTPVAVITDTDFVRFDTAAPTPDELHEWQIPRETDLYGPMLTSAPWQKGKK